MTILMQDKDGARILKHGHSGYARGCRCDECRSGKSAYDKAAYEAKHGPSRPKPTLRERIFSQLVIDAESGCLLWAGHIDDKGYGRTYVPGHQPRHPRIHQIMWEMLEGPVPGGMELDHVRKRGCANRHCASIAHLEPVTHAENMHRAGGVKTHCRNKHALTPDNIYISPKGRRSCRICRAESTIRSRANKPKVPVVVVPRTHCDKGHELTAENTYVQPDGRRRCKSCRLAAKRRYRARRDHPEPVVPTPLDELLTAEEARS